ncbi:MAG: tetratricopeptide repeat protein, partial [Proteobacteria bacterium]|nr:tetratricopeptide repeat protein [Pseudomonadota bacterium]MBU1611340.1 tetratricopeptide repeat protein [Pseudomonadota bacterium]
MLMIKGESLIGLGRFEEGVACLEAAHASAPLYLDPLERLVRAYVGRDDGKRLHWLEVLDNISPRNLRRKYDVGRLHQRLGNQEEGERRFSEAMTLARTESPHIFSQVAVDIAEVVVDQSLPLAESFLIEAMNSREGKFGPDDMMLFNRLGLNLRRQGKWKDAEACYVRALTISPKDEGLHYNLGMVLAEAGDLHGALARFDKALALNPNLGSDSKTVSVNMGHVYLQAGLHERAVVFFEQALALTPNDNAILRALQHARQAA